MNDARQPQIDTPQLRTLLLTDLCDSTELIEKLGDAPAAELFREHDTLVLNLQQEWRGRLIDRSDGLLLVFERPIDGLGFALDYQRGLDALGRQRKLLLRARAGLHVGEVLTWRNSDAAVQIGAKPLEVEGLAKPMAARLMALARPGQILVSAVAESLTHRAARELGPRGEQLLWKSYGRWRFKGVPTGMEIYEVGEIGRAQLRAPKSSPKAWRDIPLWRRPAALVAEVALVATIGAGAWLFTRPAPALAFAERDWVVVGDMRNLTGDPLLDDSLQQAFRISLERSRYVNVLSDLRLAQTLQLMGKQPGQVAVGREMASQVALRNAARAVLLPSVDRAGGKLRFTVELVDPATQVSLWSDTVEGRDARSLLVAIDDASERLRQQLGESVSLASRDSTPLPEVSTGNLEALKMYALGQREYGQGRFQQAGEFFRQATLIDPEFALAHMGMLRVALSLEQGDAAKERLSRAQASRDHLTARERLYLDAFGAELSQEADAALRWKVLADSYPDYFSGPANYAANMLEAGRFEEAERYAARGAVAQNPLAALSWDLKGRAELAQGELAAAERSFRTALGLGYAGVSRRLAGTLAAAGRYDEALAALVADEDMPVTAYIERTSIALTRGRAQEALALSREAVKKSQPGTPLNRVMSISQGLASAQMGDKPAAIALFRGINHDALGALEGEASFYAQDNAIIAMAAAYASARMGDDRLLAPTLASMQAREKLMARRPVAQMAALLKAVSAGSLPDRIEQLRAAMDGTEPFQLHVAMRDLHRLAGDASSARAQEAWIAANRGRAFGEQTAGQVFQSLNALDAVSIADPRRQGKTPAVASVSFPLER